jgi:3-phosphoshikimate 1-carboxyvinyltransferase
VIRGEVAAPASKSVTNRLLVIAALAEGPSTLRGPLVSDDTEAMADLVTALGASVTQDGDAWHVDGTGGQLAAPATPIDARLSGTTMRFGMALAALASRPVELTGAPGLLARPVRALTETLGTLGATASDTGGYPPVRVGGGLDGGDVVVDAGRSTQFASAILLVAPYARRPVRVEIVGAGAPGYIELTAALMRDWGADVDLGHISHVNPSRYQSRDVTVEYDASAAAHLLALGVATGGTVTVTNASPDTLQPDAGIVDVFAEMGATVNRDGHRVSVTGPGAPLPVDVDLARMPDQLPTVAALAALAPGRSRITGVAVTRGHETDRIAAVAKELGKLGISVEERPDGLVVHGGRPQGSAEIDPHGDHRMAMAFAAIAAQVPGVRIGDPGCVAKTYPAFWEDAAMLGLVPR